MAKLPKPITNLIEAFEKLPGIGPKSAQRLAYHLLHAPKEQLEHFAETIMSVKNNVRLCKHCFNVSDQEVCDICTDVTRDHSIVAVVEAPLDILALEKTNFKGLYHVLHGAISPLDNIGPDQLYIRQLLPRLRDGVVKELILATNPTLEGEATAMYIHRLTEPLGVKLTRIARGLPVGGDIEYADEVTLRRAMESRNVF
ncbi:MAG: recombination mediator RecR [bacterium]|nr:recombination mediator RecR [bacterium]